jgi:hypothetical protein
MAYKGHIRNSAVVFDEPVHLPEGTAVTVEILPGAVGPRDISHDWLVVQKELDSLAQKSQELSASDLTPPAPIALENARRLLQALRTQNLTTPSRILPDGQGGVVLEWLDVQRREILRTIEITSNGDIERADFANNRLQSRHSVQLS